VTTTTGNGRRRRVITGAVTLLAALFATASGPVAVAAAGSAGTPTRSAEAAGSNPPSVVVIGSPGLTWSAITSSSTPALWRLATSSALGALSVKAAPAGGTCADDGWLTVGAGDRADAGDAKGDRCLPSTLAVAASGGGATVAGYARAAHRNAAGTDAAHLGALSAALAGKGECVAAAGRGAALAAADPAGRVSVFAPDAASVAGDPAFLSRCPVTVLSAESPAAADRVVAAVAGAAPSAVVLVIGVGESAGRTAHLEAALASGGTYSGGRLVSASTRRTPFVQLVDVAPTVLGLRGVAAPHAMIGEPWRSTGHSGNVGAEVSALARLDLEARRQVDAVVPFWLALVGCVVAAALLAWFGARVVPRAAVVACTWSGLLLAASFVAGIVPWWRTAHPLVVLMAVTAGIAAAMAAGVLALRAWRPAGWTAWSAIGAVTFCVIGVDLLTGGGLEIFTMAGYSPLVAGRFAGIGNVAFGVYAAGALLTAGGLAAALPRARPAWVAAAIGVVAIAIDGGPPWGSDVGGVLALVPGVAVLCRLLARRRLSWRRSAGIALAAVAVVAALGVVDYARPAEHRTHLGRFVGDVLHGGAWTIVRRKALADARLTASSVLTLLIPVMVVVAVLLLRRPGRRLRAAFAAAPPLRPTSIALLVTVTVGALVNDSGIVIPALAVLVALPATMTVLVDAQPPAAGAVAPVAGRGC
jgi:hypothetical protein